VSKPKASVLDAMLAYAEANPAQRKLECSTCKLPADVRKGLSEMKKRGFVVRQMVGAIEAVGYKLTVAQLRYHFSAGHEAGK
jgi:hypothetical protein